jgi:hypothetical protein
MKNYIVLYIIITMFSCNTKQQDKQIPVSDSAVSLIKKDTLSRISDSHYFWTSELGAGGLVMVKTRPASADSLTAPIIVAMLNSQYPEITLVLTKISNDTLFIKILRSDYLTQQIGTSGSEAFLAEATYNLTELKDINFVDFKFKEGDHAQPGTFSRTDFIRTNN